jgi:hypothetical protein
MRSLDVIAFLPDIRTGPWCMGGFETRPYVRLSRPMAIVPVNCLEHRFGYNEHSD